MDILNGNVGGDKLGILTYREQRGKSAIDYVITNEDGKDEVKSMVGGARIESDHMPLEVTLRTKGEEKKKQRNG